MGELVESKISISFFLLLRFDVQNPPADSPKFIEVLLRGRGDIKGHLVSLGFRGAKGLRMKFAGGAAEEIKELTFLLRFGIAGDESAKRVEMSLDAESVWRRERGKFFGFHVAALMNPVIKLGLLCIGEFKQPAVGAGFHKVRGKV